MVRISTFIAFVLAVALLSGCDDSTDGGGDTGTTSDATVASDGGSDDATMATDTGVDTGGTLDSGAESDAAMECGELTQPCCIVGVDARLCNSGACVADICQDCGAPGQSCCANDECGPGLTCTADLCQ